ncbi:MAG: DUF4838 domain-containing protein [Planctomycetota bacterium]
MRRWTVARTMMLAAGIAFIFATRLFAVTLVRDGEPEAVIVLGKEPSPVAFEAAVELQRVIERASGAKLPIYLENEWTCGMEGPRRSAPRIFVGDSQTAREAGLDLSGVAPEGYVIKSTMFSPTRPSPETHDRKPANTHPAIILAGRDDAGQNWNWRGDRADRYLRGTAYAVYDFLENDLAVRWLWPGELGEVVPQMKTLDVSPLDRTNAPKLRMRIFRNNRYYASGWWRVRDQVGTPLAVWTRMADESRLWLDHMRMGDGSNWVKPSKEGVGAPFVEKYAKTHPEYFAMQPDGTRLTKELYGRVQICLSNPEVIEIIAEEASQVFEARPDLTMYGIELCDVFGSYCQCESCKAWGPTLSDLVARHWSAVAEKVAQKHPDKLLYAHPYDKYIDPPEELKSIPDNIMLAPVGQNLSGYTAAADRERSIRSWLGWSKLNTQKMLWRPNYPCADVGLPLNYARKLADDIKLFYQNKLSGVDIDSMRGIWAGDGLNYYVACRLVWNPQEDYDPIILDYCDKGFGAAAPQVRAYLDAVEEITDRIARHEETGTHPMGLPGGESAGVGLAVHFTPEVTGRLNALLDEAAKAAGDDEPVRARVDFLRVAVTYAELEHQVNAAGRALDAAPQAANEEVRKTQALLAERQAFLRGFVGRWELEPEAAWTGADWVQKIIADESARADLFADLWFANTEVMTIPEDWKFAIDPSALSMKEEWYAKDYDDSQWATIKVGDFWERQGYKGYDGIAWYRRKLTLPESLKGKRVLFAFGAADENALVFIDGKEAAKHDDGPGGWDKRFVLDLTDAATPGVEQTYAIRVIDTVGAGGLWKPIKVMTPRDAGEVQKATLVPDKDTWLRRNYPTTAYGKDPNLAAGTRDYFRTLLAWELPTGIRTARVASARVVLPLRYVTGGGTFALYPFRTDWHERRATWQNRDAQNVWEDGEGGMTPLPRKPAAEVTLAAVTLEQTEKMSDPPLATFDVTASLRETLAKEADSFGALIVGMGKDAVMSPHAREAADQKLRPRLEIEYLLEDGD